MIDFLRYRYACLAFSVIMIATFFGVFFYKRATTGQAFKYSVEFTGGTQVLFGFDNPVKLSDVKNALATQGWENAVYREFGPKEVLVRVQEYGSDAVGLGERMRQELQEKFNDTSVRVLQIDSIGQGVGEALSWNSIKAIIIALIAMSIYMGLRFLSFPFAFGAVIALFHDALAILLLFMLIGQEMSVNVIGAILTILGYSINDTIVIFTQIRNNLRSKNQETPYNVANLSLNQTLRRTILTSIATALIAVALVALGGETLRDLSLALLVGIIFGTYSSIYIASPIMLLFYKRKSA